MLRFFAVGQMTDSLALSYQKHMSKSSFSMKGSFFLFMAEELKQALSTNSLQMCIMGAYKIEKTGGGIWLLQEMKI